MQKRWAVRRLIVYQPPPGTSRSLCAGHRPAIPCESVASMYEIRANYNASSVVVYQAYGDDIAEPALKAQRFVPPFSTNRMTWIKPSFLWLMHRSNWGRKAGQERTLAVRISRDGWEKALSLGVLTAPEPRVHGSAAAWEKSFRNALVHVQWDTERSIRGAALDHYAIQVGLGRQVIHQFVESWTISIEDLTPIVEKMRKLLDAGDGAKAKRFLPTEAVYTTNVQAARRLLIEA